MSSLSRRMFLGTLSSPILASASPSVRADAVHPVPAEQSPCTAGSRPAELKGLVHGLGLSGRLFPGQEAVRDRGVSIITSLDLSSGATRQTPLMMGEGHAAMGMGDGRILCVAHHQNKSMVLDPNHKIIAEFVAPSTHVYSGHGLVFRERNLFIIPMRSARQTSAGDQGRMQVYDLTSLKLLDEVGTGGLHPHEIHPIPGTNELVTTHYGDIGVRRKPFEHNVIETKLTILDAATFRPKRHYLQQEFNAMVTHMRVAKDGWAYFVLTQYIAWPSAAELKQGEDAFTVAAQELDKAMGRRRTFPLPYHTLDDELFPLPLPFVRVNTQTGDRQIVNAGDANHLRSQSVAYNDVTDYAIALYFQSDTLVIHKPDDEPEIITGEQLHLTDIRGVTEIPGTSLIAVMGTYRGVSVMDLADRQVVAHYPTLNYEDTHLYYDLPATA